MTLRIALRRLLPVLLVLTGIPAQGEGPLYVGGPPPYNPGVPFRWNINPVTYWTDLGTLGSQTKTQADKLVSDAFGVWAGVPTATITFSKAGDLTVDIKGGIGSNAAAAQEAINNCSTPLTSASIVRDRTIIYDTDGSVIDTLLGSGQSDTTLGFADALCFSSDGTNSFGRGFAVLNGKFTKNASDLAELKAVMIHEFGHMIGLDHSQVNVNCLGLCGAADKAGLPTMFPILVDGTAMSSLATDDKAGISTLYPTTTTTTGTITGNLYFSDGMTPAQGFNVIARLVDNPVTTTVDESRVTAVSNVSGFLFTGDAGNPLVQDPTLGTPSPFGSRDTSLIGVYRIPGLPSGTYTLEVEGINNTGTSAFVGGSGLNPVGYLGFEFNLLADCSPLFLSKTASLATCTAAEKRTIVVGTGETKTGIDILLIGTTGSLPCYDAWEDGPTSSCSGAGP
jgi:hypothetical protein